MATNEQVHLPEDWAVQAECNDLNVEQVWSCYHYLCENAFGFTTTHPKYTDEWLENIRRDTEAFHGPEATRTIMVAVDYTGDANVYPFDPKVVECMLKLAILQSELHRKVRNH